MRDDVHHNPDRHALDPVEAIAGAKPSRGLEKKTAGPVLVEMIVGDDIVSAVHSGVPGRETCGNIFRDIHVEGYFLDGTAEVRRSDDCLPARFDEEAVLEGEGVPDAELHRGCVHFQLVAADGFDVSQAVVDVEGIVTLTADVAAADPEASVRVGNMDGICAQRDLVLCFEGRVHAHVAVQQLEMRSSSSDDQRHPGASEYPDAGEGDIPAFLSKVEDCPVIDMVSENVRFAYSHIGCRPVVCQPEHIGRDSGD